MKIKDFEISDGQFIGLVLFFGFALELALFSPLASKIFGISVIGGSLWFMFLNAWGKRKK